MATKTTTDKTNITDQTELVKTLEAQIEGLQSDVHALMKAVTDKGESKLDQAADAVNQTSQKAAEAMSQTSQKTAELANEEIEQVRKYIKNQPLRSVGLALGVGAVLALLARG